MRTTHKAAEQRQAHALELLLEHPRGQAILEASGGDAEHGLRVLQAVRRREADAPLAEVIRLPREPILDFNDVLAPDLEDELEPARGVDWRLALSLGLNAFVALAVVVLAAVELLRRSGVL